VSCVVFFYLNRERSRNFPSAGRPHVTTHFWNEEAERDQDFYHLDANHPSGRIHLVLSGGDGELEVNTLAGQSLVDLRVGVEAVVNTTTLLLVKNDLEDLGAVLLGAHALANNLDGVDEVGKDGVVDSSQSARTRALLGLAGARAVAALGAGQDAAGSDDEDVAVRELLLELTGQAGHVLVDDRRAVMSVDAYRCWTLWKPWSWGTGTKMTMAFLP
jgi:hypothetical protein